MKSHYLWIIDAGHGNIAPDGRYTTRPYWNKEYQGWEVKKHMFPDGSLFVEGAWTHEIADRVCIELVLAGIEFRKSYDPIVDTPLRDRVALADALYAIDRRAVFVSIHSDKSSLATIENPTLPEHYKTRFKATGFSVYTSIGETRSDKFAQVFCEMYQEKFPDMLHRSDKSDGDLDMESDFYVLKKTDCPALLIENGFYDNFSDYKFIASSAGKDRIVNCIVEAIKKCEAVRPA